jgi:hypothetical protein
MSDYDVIESALRDLILTKFPDELTEERCKIADPDKLFEEMFRTRSDGSPYGCLLDYGDGREDTSQPFKHQVWIWTIVGIFMIRYNDDIETQARMIIRKLKRLFVDDHTIGGVTVKAKMVAINPPEPTQVNDVPHYFIPFVVEAWDK